MSPYIIDEAYLVENAGQDLALEDVIDGSLLPNTGPKGVGEVEDGVQLILVEHTRLYEEQFEESEVNSVAVLKYKGNFHNIQVSNIQYL